MKTTKIIILLIIILPLMAFNGDKQAYVIYNAKGKKVEYRELLKSARNSDIIFFGELHDNAICHWLEFEFTRDLYADKGKNLVLGAEMFEVDNQLLINEYLSKMIRKKDFESEAKLWPNYKTDYAPLVDFARENGLKFLATNVPRRYAALVNQKGFEGLDSLNALQRGLVAPLPLKYPDTLSCYADISKATGSEGSPAHVTANLGKAQALKDATMAHFLMKHAFGEKTLLHFNGSYHSDNYEGMVWYVNQIIRKTSYEPRLMTITCIEQENLDSLSKEQAAKADFIILIPSTMTRTR